MQPNPPRLILVGHTEYSSKIFGAQTRIGEVNQARKLCTHLLKSGFDVTEVLDIYELFGISGKDDKNFALIEEMAKTNRLLAEVGQEMITDFDNLPARTCKNKFLEILNEKENSILFSLTWPSETLKLLSIGIQHACPIIAKEYSYMKDYYRYHSFPLGNFSSDAHLIVSESLLGCLNAKDAGVAPGHFSYLPNPAPDAVFSQEEIAAYRKKYLAALTQSRPRQIDDNTLLIGCPSRCMRGKNVEMLIYAVSELYAEFPNTLLILKGGLSAEYDNRTHYTEKLHQVIKSAEQEP